MLAAPVDTAGRVIRLSDFEFPPEYTVEDKLWAIRDEVYQIAVEQIDPPDADDATRWAAWDEETERIMRQVRSYYFGNTD